jgi:hypothetical protein
MINEKDIKGFINKVNNKVRTDMLIVGVDDSGETTIVTSGDMGKVACALYEHLYDTENADMGNDLQTMLVNITYNALLNTNDKLSEVLINMFYNAMEEIRNKANDGGSTPKENKNAPNEKAKTVPLFGSQAPKVD